MAADVRIADFLAATARDLCDRLGADACAISRVVGDVIILVAEYAPDGSLQLGQGYLVPDYPKTRAVVRDRTAYRLTLDDPAADAAEAAVVRELGFGALLMLPLEVAGDAWGLVELYRREMTAFDDAQVVTAVDLLAAAAARIP